MRDISWPVFAFASNMFPSACEDLQEIAEFEEPLGWEELVAFDSKFWRLYFREVDEGIDSRIAFAKVEREPDEIAFRVAARTALRLHGPGALWRRGRLRRESELDTFGLASSELQRLISAHFS